MRYFVVRCAGCGRWQSCFTKRLLGYVFRCRRCKFSRKLKKSSEFGLSLDAKEVGCVDANRVCSLLNDHFKL